ELLERPEADAELRVHRAAVRRHDHAERRGAVRRGAAKDLSFVGRFAHEADVALLEIADAAVDQLRAAARRARRAVGAPDERGGDAAEGGVARDAGAGDAAADDEEVDRLPGKRGQRLLARLGREPRGHPGATLYLVPAAAPTSVSVCSAVAILSARF